MMHGNQRMETGFWAGYLRMKGREGKEDAVNDIVLAFSTGVLLGP